MKTNAVGFSDLEDVREGLLVLKGNRYRAVVTADPINFSLLSQEEQEGMEDAFASFLMGLTFPLQFLSLFRPVDMRDTIALMKRGGDLPGLSAYAAEMENFLSYFASRINTTESYVIVPYDDPGKNYRKARGELMRRVQTVTEGLAKCGLAPRMLDTVELLQFLYAFYHRDGKIRIEELLNSGALELWKEGGSSLEVSHRQVQEKQKGQ